MSYRISEIVAMSIAIIVACLISWTVGRYDGERALRMGSSFQLSSPTLADSVISIGIEAVDSVTVTISQIGSADAYRGYSLAPHGFDSEGRDISRIGTWWYEGRTITIEGRAVLRHWRPIPAVIRSMEARRRFHPEFTP